jgi:hypothetical protein
MILGWCWVGCLDTFQIRIEQELEGFIYRTIDASKGHEGKQRPSVPSLMLLGSLSPGANLSMAEGSCSS